MWSRAKDLKRTSEILLKAIKCFSNFGFSSLFLTEKEQMGTEVNSAIWKDWRISMKRARCQVCSSPAQFCQLSTSKPCLNKGWITLRMNDFAKPFFLYLFAPNCSATLKTPVLNRKRKEINLKFYFLCHRKLSALVFPTFQSHSSLDST